MGSYWNPATEMAGVALMVALGSLGVLRGHPQRRRLARWIMGASLVLLGAASAWLPAHDWIYRLMNALMGWATIGGATIPAAGALITARWFRETLAEARGYEPMEVALSIFAAAALLVAGAAAVVFPLSWLVDHLPKWALPIFHPVAWVVFAVAGAILLKLGGTIGIMARRLAALTFLLICVAADVGLWWGLRELVPQPFLNVATLVFLVVTAGAVWSMAVRTEVATTAEFLRP